MIIPQDFIEQVKLANNIVVVAGRYLPIKQKGRQYWAPCPFHHEKTPSFTINEQDQYYHCFGCRAHGNVFSLVGHLENLEFVQSVELLAKWANLKMPETAYDPKELEKQRYKQRILDIIDHAREFYVSNTSDTARKYLNGRGINDELIERFNLGQSPNWDGVITHLKQKGYTEKELVDSGVAAKSEKGRIYDAMGERITFSIFDLMGNCIGFTGRVLPEKDNGQVAKYRNTAQSPVFDKGKIVYGADVLKKYLRTAPIDNIIMVEGNMDTVSLVAAGFNNTLACMGTAVTQFHAKAAKRFSDQIYVCFDGDSAGMNATIRSVDIFAEEGLQVRVISLPKDTDPDSFIRKNGADAFIELVNTAKPIVDYKLDILAGKSNLNDNLGKTKYLNAAIEILKNIKGPEIELYIPKVAKLSGVSKETIMKTVGIKKPAPQKETIPLPKEELTKYERAKNFIETFDKAPSTLHGTAKELSERYQDCLRVIEEQTLRKKRDELQKLFEDGDTTVIKEIQEINRRLKNGRKG